MKVEQTLDCLAERNCPGSGEKQLNAIPAPYDSFTCNNF